MVRWPGILCRRRAVVAVLLVAFGLWEAGLAAVIPFGETWDEWQHFSLVQDLRRDPQPLPDHFQSRLLTPAGGWSDTVSYLAHPPLYHLVAALVPAEAVAPETWKRTRTASLVLVLAALAALAAHGLRRFDGVLPPVAAVAVPAAFAPLAIAGAMVTNDSLAFACGVGVCVGIDRWVDEPGDRRWLAVAAAMLVVAGWTKLVAAVLLFALAAFMVLASPGLHVRRRVWALAVIAAAAVPAAIPTAVNIVRFGLPVFPGHLFIGHHHEMAPVGFAAWTAVFLAEMVQTGMALSGSPADPVRWSASAAVLAGTPVAAAALLRHRPARGMAAATLAAAGLTLALHLHYTHRVHLEVGLNPHHAGAHARLYLPLLPAVGLLAGHAARMPRARPAVAALLAGLFAAAMPVTVLRHLLP